MPSAAGAALVAVIVLSAAPAAAARPGLHSIAARTIAAQIARGDPVSYSEREVRGVLKLPATVTAPVRLVGMTFLGRVEGSSTVFQKLVDLHGSTFHAGADFSGATFAAPSVVRGVRCKGTRPMRFDFAVFRGAVFVSGAQLDCPATFSDAEFDRTSRFRSVHFGGIADFDSAWFGDVADFTGARYAGDARFEAVEFKAGADFSAAEFGHRALFSASRFGAPVDFTAAVFGGQSGDPAWFRTGRFEDGATFLDAEFDGDLHFERAHADGDMIFDGAEFDGQTSFSTSSLLGATTFAQASLYGPVDFDQAVVRRLDLDGATFIGAKATLALPLPTGSVGHLDELRFDPTDVRHIGVGRGKSTDETREHALALVEAAALAGGDARAANKAQLRRWTLKRGDRPAVLRLGDWVVMWGIGGYLVAPWHQVATLLALLLLCAVVRSAHARSRSLVVYAKNLRSSFSALWHLHLREGTGWAQAEAVLYDVVLIVLLLNIANVWPTGHDILKGVLP